MRPGLWRAILKRTGIQEPEWVTGQTIDELTLRASEAIQLYWQAVRTDLSPTSVMREIEVELPA